MSRLPDDQAAQVVDLDLSGDRTGWLTSVRRRLALTSSSQDRRP
ncbi:hypothetical protein [Actinomycetospora callitridis]|nr:hypothetical protein [Actinomycetospora callitridis]MDD7918154.1 hypothetical protein [Actinomycetospora callitridis]